MSSIKPLELHSTALRAPSPYMSKILSKDFLDFWNSTMVGLPAIRNMPPNMFKASGRPSEGTLPGGLPPVSVGKEEDVFVPRKYTKLTYPSIPIAVYTPPGPQPSEGWPVIYNIHGGGWVLGSSTGEAALSTRMCIEAKAVVVSPEYRLAPEWPYPAHVEDCWEVLLWIYEEGKSQLGVDVSRMIISGTSAGALLSATMINMLIDEPSAPKDLKFKLALMNIPAFDSTAADPSSGSPTWDKYKSWTECADAPSLPAAQVHWFRNLFLPNLEHRSDWHASPNLAPDHFWAKHPPTRISVCEVDVLRDEGLYYAEKLKAAGVPVEVEMYKGAPHTAFLHASVVAEGRRQMEDMARAAKKALWPEEI